jgi:hypothetical protein
MQGAWTGVFKGTRVRLCRILHTNFYEKALFVKPTWRLVSVAECNGFECPSRYASIRTLGELSVLGSSVHRMRSVLIRAL